MTEIAIPHSIVIEQALLGSFLLDAGSFEHVAETLSSKHFFDGVHADLFDLMRQRYVAGRAISMIALSAEVANWTPIEATLTVSQYLGRLLSVGNPREVRDYAHTIRELAQRRALIEIGLELTASAQSGDETSNIVHKTAEARLFDLAELGTTSREFSFSEALADALQRANAAYQKDGGLSGLSTGFADLDFKLGGLQDSDLIILAGRPSIGKTSLATNIAHNVARFVQSRPVPPDHVSPGHVHFFSQEMSKDQLATRLISEHSGVASDKIRRGTISEIEFRRVNETAISMNKLPITIDETGGISIATLCAKARRLARRFNTSLIVVDYIQLMQSDSRRGGNRVQEVSEITTGLKALAKELNVPILALSQLSRQVENREDKRPQLSDLRDSGSIEQDADVVLFVYRDDYYLDRQEPDVTDVMKHSEWQAKVASAKGKAEVIVAKSRHSSVGTVHMAFDSHLTRFANLAREHHRRNAYAD